MRKQLQRTLMFSALMIGPMAGANAQTIQIGDSTTMNIGSGSATGANAITLGTSGTTGYLSQMPMSLSYGAVGVNVSFTGDAGVAGSNDYWNPGTTDFFQTGWNNSGQITFEFTKTQQFFGLQWGSPDVGNTVKFYNGSTLLATATSSDALALGAAFTPAGAYTEFQFADLGFDRAVVYATGARWEFSNVSFSESVSPAPIPVGGLGGLLTCLGMLGARRHGGRWPFATRNAKLPRKVRMRPA